MELRAPPVGPGGSQQSQRPCHEKSMRGHWTLIEESSPLTSMPRNRLMKLPVNRARSED